MYFAILSYGARDPSDYGSHLFLVQVLQFIQVKLSTKKEQCGPAASKLGWNIDFYTTMNWLLTSKSSDRVCFPFGHQRYNFLLTTTKYRLMQSADGYVRYAGLCTPFHSRPESYGIQHTPSRKQYGDI